MQTSWQSIPKVELHLHLDPSIGFDVVESLRPGTTQQDYIDTYVGPERCDDLSHFLRCIEPSIALLQTRTALELAVASLLRRLQQDNVIYAELRFAPLIHTRAGLAPEEVMEAVLSSFRQSSRRLGIEGGVIVCTLRQFTDAQSIQTAQLAARYRDHGVIGFDLAGDEANFPLHPHIKPFRIALDAGLGTTAHAGEALGAESVGETLDLLQPQRIGHGVRSIEDQSVVDRLARAGVHLETCPSSNIQIGVFPAYSAHPTPSLRRAGVSVGLNTDTRTFCPVTLSQEYEKMAQTFRWDKSDFEALNLNAVRASFVTADVKAKVTQRLLGGASIR